MVVSVVLSSCEKEHEENPYIQLTNELQAKYKSFVIGDWLYEEESDKKKEAVFLSLREDGSMQYHDVYNKREEVKIGGVLHLLIGKQCSMKKELVAGVCATMNMGLVLF